LHQFLALLARHLFKQIYASWSSPPSRGPRRTERVVAIVFVLIFVVLIESASPERGSWNEIGGEYAAQSSVSKQLHYLLARNHNWLARVVHLVFLCIVVLFLVLVSIFVVLFIFVIIVVVVVVIVVIIGVFECDLPSAEIARPFCGILQLC